MASLIRKNSVADTRIDQRHTHQSRISPGGFFRLETSSNGNSRPSQVSGRPRARAHAQNSRIHGLLHPKPSIMWPSAGRPGCDAGRVAGLSDLTDSACWSQSATSHPPKPRNATTPSWTSQLWPHNLTQTASGELGRFRVADALRKQTPERQLVEIAIGRESSGGPFPPRRASSPGSPDRSRSLARNNPRAGQAPRSLIGTRRVCRA
jgi:hypothetical protein